MGATIRITGTFTNCTCNYVDGEEYFSTKPFEIVGNGGALFDGVFQYIIRDSEGGTYYENFINDGNSLIPNISDFQTKADWNSSYNIIELHSNYIAIGGSVETNQFTNIYLTNNSELGELSLIRYYENEGSLVDYGKYIVSLFKIPFIVPSDILIDDYNIKLGNKQTDIESTLIVKDNIVVDMGNIYVEEKYNNVYDYVNTNCILHLPLFDKIYLENEYVINQTINIKYFIDLYSGNCTVNIYSSFIDSIVITTSNIVSNNIPFIENSNTTILNNLTNYFKNDIETPFIEVVRNIPYTKDKNIFGGGVVEYGKIGDYKGYLECDNVLLKTNANNQDKNEIITLLQKGVLIND